MALPGAEGLPAVDPNAGAAPFQTVRADREAFGGRLTDTQAQGQEGQARGLEQLGRGLTIASQNFDALAGQDASNQFQEQATKLLYGDPTKKTMGPDGAEVPDLGYFGTKGAAALERRQPTEKALADLEKNIGGKLMTPAQKERFSNFVSSFRSNASAKISNYADNQTTVYGENTLNATAKLQLATIAANPNDPAILAQAAADLRAARVKQAQLKGGGPEMINEAIATADREFLTTQVAAIGTTDPGKALRILEKNKEIAGAAYPTLYAHFKGEANNQEADAVVAAYTGGGIVIPETAKRHEPLVQQVATKAGVPVPLAMGVLTQESGGNPNAVSKAGAGGLMQLMPGTAQDLGVTNVFDSTQNVNGGVRYLKEMLEKYKNNVPLALMGYNWGPGNVDKWLKTGSDPEKVPAETRDYIQKVQGYAASYGGKVDAKAMSLDLQTRTDLPVAVKSLASAKLDKQTSTMESMRVAQLKELGNTLEATTQLMIYAPQTYKKGSLTMIADAQAAAGDMAASVNTRILAQHEDLLLTFSTSSDAGQRRIIEGLLPGHAKALAGGILAADEKTRADAKKQATVEFAGIKEAVEAKVPIDTLGPKLKGAVETALKGADFATAQEIIKYAESQSLAAKVNKQTPTAVDATINELKTTIEKGQQDNTTISTLKVAEDIRAKQKEAFSKDAFATGTDLYPDIGKAAPIPWGAKPEELMGALAVRASQATRISENRGGIDVIPFTEPEISQLRQTLDAAPPDKQTQIMSTLAYLPKDMIPGVANALAGKNDTGDHVSRSYAAALAIYADRDPTTKPIADQIVQGTAMRREMAASGKPPPTTSDAWQTTLQDRVGSSFISMGVKVPAVISDAIASVYTYKMVKAGRQGEKGPDTDVLDAAISTVLGNTVTRNGQPFYPPVRGMTSYDVGDAMRHLNNGDMDGLLTTEGTQITADAVRNRGVLTNVGQGIYKVQVPDARLGGGLAEIVDPNRLDERGRPQAWLFDMRTLVSRSKSAPPEVNPDRDYAPTGPRNAIGRRNLPLPSPALE